METGGGRLPLQVLQDNEVLQQFFIDEPLHHQRYDIINAMSSCQDVTNVLDSSVVVDTSILEQYLSNDPDSNGSILPESPPDSSSEAGSPAMIPDFHYQPPYWSNQNVLLPQRPTPSSSCVFKDRGAAHHYMTHEQLRNLGFTNTCMKIGTSPTQPAALQHSPEHPCYLSPDSCSQVYAPPTPPSPPPTSTSLLCSTSTLHPHKKRRRSESEDPSAGIEAHCSDGTPGGNVRCGGDSSGVSLGSYQLLTWDQYRPDLWSALCSSSYQTLSPPAYHVDTDKGFVYYAADEAFVCQKKNHFQVTVHIGMATEPQYVRTSTGTQLVDHFLIKVFGVKPESPRHQVTIEQSQPDRSKKPFHPVRVVLPSGKITKVTLGRLHFSETTANNMRKKGKPNPDQRYFQMVVGLYAAVGPDQRPDQSVLITALLSEKIIVRASNPGQFETDCDTIWQRGVPPDAVVCQGQVGINTDSPDEALVVCGNAKVMGAIMQPSDHRAKENIQEVDSEQQLRNITQMRIVEFDYKPEFASRMGIDQTHQTGIIAQEVKQLLPLAVKDVGDVKCSDGDKIHNFLMVDKEQIFMENVGAVQQLSKLTDNLETRIKELEVWNRRLAKLKSLTGSLRSSRFGGVAKTANSDSCAAGEKGGGANGGCLQRKVFQASIFALLATMAFCVISISALYLLTLKEENFQGLPSNSNGSTVPPQTTAWSSTAEPATSPPGHWPPDVNFCDLLYCDQVYCCSPPARGSKLVVSPAEGESNVTGVRAEKFYHSLRGSSDWTNTTIQSFTIKENQQPIDSRYCLRNEECGPGRYTYRVPISQFVPVNMRVTLVMNSTELLVVHLCDYDESVSCSALLDANTVTVIRYPYNTQGEHEWPLHVSRLYHGSYHFRSAVAGQADCSTDHHYEGALFTDYHFHFYRRCLQV